MKKVLVGALIASVATFGLAGIASADNHDEGIFVTNNNGASVQNSVTVKAYTGRNDANGGNAGNGGDAGSVNNSDDDNTGGNGGNAGDGGMGGAIFTGGAIATALVANDVNNNDVRVNACECELDLVRIRNNNGADVQNGLSVYAKTGKNDADGGEAGSAGNGGSVNNSDDDNTGGRGGNSGNGGAGGWIETGLADSYAEIVNFVNSNIVRIR